MNILKKIKWWLQRANRGYADCDVWDFDDYLCKIIPQALRELKKGIGSPSEFYDKEKVNDESHLWHEALEAMAQGFEAANFLKNNKYLKWVKKDDEKLKGSILETDYEAMKNAHEKMELGLKLFAENFLSLWD